MVSLMKKLYVVLAFGAFHCLWLVFITGVSAGLSLYGNCISASALFVSGRALCLVTLSVFIVGLGFEDTVAAAFQWTALSH
jgi:hypothetical protein